MAGSQRKFFLLFQNFLFTHWIFFYFHREMPLTHMQKDLRLALQLGEAYEHPLPITASTNEVFKHAKHLGYAEHDVAAVYIRSRF